MAGRGDEAKSYLDEALSLSRELKSDDTGAAAWDSGAMRTFTAEISNQPTLPMPKRFRSRYEARIQSSFASRKRTWPRLRFRRNDVQEAISSLRQLVPQADGLGLKYTSVESSIFIAEAMMQIRDRSPARQELERALLLSDKLGMQPLSARAHYLLAVIARESGNASDAQDHYHEALRLLDAMKKDPGAEKLLQRSDFKSYLR